MPVAGIYGPIVHYFVIRVNYGRGSAQSSAGNEYEDGTGSGISLAVP